MSKRSGALLIVICLLLMTACGQSEDYQSQSFFAMDTLAEVRIYSAMDGAASVFGDCKTMVSEIETAISATEESGDLFRFNASVTGIDSVSDHLVSLIKISEEISALTEGAFDVRTGALIALWKLCESQGRLPEEEELRHAVSLIDGQVYLSDSALSKSHPDIQLNFGAVGKGYAADRLAEVLRARGVSCGMISFVSTVTVFGDRETGDFKIAVRRPDLSGELAGYITMNDESLSVSGNYERYYEIGGVKYDHILDPKTGYPAAMGIDSVAVVASSGAVSDALSTAIPVMGAEKTLALYKSGVLAFEAAIFCNDEILVTDGFAERFTLMDDGYRVVLLSERY